MWRRTDGDYGGDGDDGGDGGDGGGYPSCILDVDFYTILICVVFMSMHRALKLLRKLLIF